MDSKTKEFAAQAVQENRNTKMTAKKYTTPDAQGYYGKFGGAYIPEMLHPNVEELKDKIPADHEPDFQKEFQQFTE